MLLDFKIIRIGQAIGLISFEHERETADTVIEICHATDYCPAAKWFQFINNTYYRTYSSSQRSGA